MTVAVDQKKVQKQGRVIGIGGVFIKSADHRGLSRWYREKLGLPHAPGQRIKLKWRLDDDPNERHSTTWSAFAESSRYFDPCTAPFMINYIVDDLDALLEKLRGWGVKIDPKREEHDYGRFAWVFDPDGNKIEIWEPAKQDE